MTRRTRWIVSGIGWALVIALAVVLWLGDRDGFGAEADTGLDLQMPIAPFELIDQDSHPWRSELLRGKVWITGFAFTSCTSVCPMLTSQMVNLQHRLAPMGDRVHLVTITVDPAVDTPERLREYALQQNADLSRWSFLTGAPADVRSTLERVFFVPVGERREVENGYDILHTGQLMLIDRNLRMRGLYPTDAAGLERLERDVEQLLNE